MTGWLEMEDGWWLADGENRRGPLSTEQVQELVRQGTVGSSARIWRQGALSWKSLNDVAEFARSPDIAWHPPASANPPGRREPVFDVIAVPSPHPGDELPSWARVAPLPATFSRDVVVLEHPLAGPWTRFLARSLDICVLSVPMHLLLALIAWHYWPAFALWMHSPNSAGGIGLVTIPLALLAESVLFGLFGTTYGKLLLGVRVCLLGGARPSFVQYSRRMLGVYWSGLAVGFPLLSLFTMWRQHSRVKAKRPASYDEGRFQVHVMRMSSGRRTASAFAVVATLVGIGYANYLVQIDQREYLAGYEWRNPISNKTTTIPPGWMFTQQVNAQEDPIFTFSSDAAGVVTVFAMEDAGDLTLDQYQRDWTAVVRSQMALDIRATPFVFEGRIGLQMHGVMATNATRLIHVTLVKNGHQVWRMVSIGVSGKNPDSKATEALRGALLRTLPERPERPDRAPLVREHGQPV